MELTKDKDILVLGIESSCDETAASVVKNGRIVLSNVISSQIETHKIYGGVVPEIASRKHVESISDIVDCAMETAHVKFEDLSCIAVTCGPGLVGALLVGVAYAKALAFAINKPILGIHHIEGHINANYIVECEEDFLLEPPFMCLVVSGGHTHLVHVKDYGVYEILGKTRDDAAGEAYDKVARAIGLGYPGGPKIDTLARSGRSDAILFPRVMLEAGSYDFSFSGLKSAVLNHINKCNMMNEEINTADIAASFQRAVVDVLVKKAISACINRNLNQLVLAGGVSCNSALREAMTIECAKNGIKLQMPKPIFCTDNAAMIAATGYFDFINGKRDDYTLNAYPSYPLEQGLGKL